MKVFVLLFHLLFISSQAFAADCSPVNLITSPSSPFTKIPVYDQKDANICYAFSAAQMMNYYLIKTGADRPSVHPVWIALNYALGKNRKGLEIGHTKYSIERLSEAFNCDAEIVSKALKSWAGTENIPESRIIAFIEKYADGRNIPESSDPLILSMYSRLRELALHPVQVVESILAPVCTKRTVIPVPKVKKYNHSDLHDDEAYERFLLQRLSTNETPISIAYCSKVWKEPDYDGIELTFLGKRDKLKKDCAYHESLVVGKKKTGDKCQFLVRNTWGDKWKSGNKKWKCLCRDRMSGKFYDDCESSTHPDEQYAVEACWIDSGKLSKNVGVITVIE